MADDGDEMDEDGLRNSPAYLTSSSLLGRRDWCRLQCGGQKRGGAGAERTLGKFGNPARLI